MTDMLAIGTDTLTGTATYANESPMRQKTLCYTQLYRTMLMAQVCEPGELSNTILFEALSCV